MNRRSLLGAILGACSAPAYVRPGVLMPVRSVWVPRTEIAPPEPDDDWSLQCWISARVYERFEQTWRGYSANSLLNRAAVDALLARDVANGCGIITID